jgi:hypothetical protein
MDFEIVGEITSMETIASGSGGRERVRLRRQYGQGRWRKRKWVARSSLLYASIMRAIPASLEVGKLYCVVPDEEAAAHGYIRLIDESGEDYAFTAERFHIVQHVPHAVGRAITGQAARRSRRRRPRMKQ